MRQIILGTFAISTGTPKMICFGVSLYFLKSFSVVVLVLKILLAQHNLDAPFTGGLGSYKLYVLVVHHLERHMALGGNDRPGEVFLSFLLRYSKVNHGLGRMGNVTSHRVRPGSSPSVSERTNLAPKTVLECKGGYSADLSAVFLLNHCIELFRRAWWKMSRKYDIYIQNTDNRSSLLVDLFDCEKLRNDRSECLEKASILSQYDKTQEFTQQQQGNKSQRLDYSKVATNTKVKVTRKDKG